MKNMNNESEIVKEEEVVVADEDTAKKKRSPRKKKELKETIASEEEKKSITKEKEPVQNKMPFWGGRPHFFESNKQEIITAKCKKCGKEFQTQKLCGHINCKECNGNA